MIIENLSKLIRSENDWTRQQLAEAMGVSVRTVEGWENGRNVRLQTMKQLESHKKSPSL